MPSLFRLLKNNTRHLLSPLRLTNYYTSGRALTGSPEVQPVPQHIYQYLYVFDYYPEALGAFNVYAMKRDQFVLENFYVLENFDFRYEGEQWHIGSVVSHFIFLLLPLMTYLFLSYEDVKNGKNKSPRNKNYNQHGAFLHPMMLLEKEPPIEED